MASYGQVNERTHLQVKQEEQSPIHDQPLKTIKAELLFYIYMAFINIFSLIYPFIFIFTSVVDSDFYSSKQNLTNYIYSSFCIVITILSIVNLKVSNEFQKEKCTVWDYFTHYFFILKINIDFFNLMKMTPVGFLFSTQLELLFTYVMTLNIFLYYYIMSNKLTEIKLLHKIFLILAIAGLSILRCILFYESDQYPKSSQNQINGLIINEASKIFYYAFIFLVISRRRSVEEVKKNGSEVLTIKKNYEDIFSILYSTADSCQCRGFIVLSKGQKIFTSNLYFKQLFFYLIKKREGSVNRSAKSQFKKSINVPSLKLSNIDVNNNSEVNKLADINAALKKFEPNTTKSVTDLLKEDKRRNSIGSSSFGSLPKKNFSANNLGMSMNYQINPKQIMKSSVNVNAVKNHLELPNIDEENDENSVFRTASLNKSKKISEDKVKSQHFLSNKSNIFVDDVIKTSSKNSKVVCSEKRKTLPNPTSSVLKILEEKSKESPGARKKMTSSSEVSSSDSDSDPEEIQLINSDILDIFNSPRKRTSICKLNKRKAISNTLTTDLRGLKNLHNFPDCTVHEGHISEIRKISKQNIQLSDLTIDPKIRILKYPKLNNLQNRLSKESRNSFNNFPSLEIDKNKNIVVNNNYNINIINSNDAIQFKESSKGASRSLKNDFFNSLNNSNSKNSNNIRGQDHQSGEIFNVNLLNCSSPTHGYNNINFLIIFANISNFTPDYNNNENLKEEISNYNKSLGSGIYLSDFINKISEILKAVNDHNLNLELGPYILTIPDMFSNNGDESLIFQNNLIYFSLLVKRTFKNDEPVDFLIIKRNNNNFNKLKKISQWKFSNKKVSNPNSYLNVNSLNKNLSVPLMENDFIGGGFMSQSSNSISQPKIRSSNSQSNSENNLLKSKISALIHDFKHVVIDNHLFYEQLTQKYKINLDAEDTLYMTVMDDYLDSLILNLTNFMKDSDNFFKGSPAENNQPVDLNHLVDIMVTVFNRRLKWENESNQNLALNEPQMKKNLKIHYTIIDENNTAGKIVQSNKNLLMSLIYNLMSNAYKYTTEGEIKVELTTINYGKKVMLKITDTGSGIPENVLKNWSKPFNMGVENQAKNAKSSGLGGFIMASIAKNLKLEMPLPEPNPLGQGTVIKVFIPVNSNMLVTNNSNSQSDKSYATRILSSERAFFINYQEKNFVNYKETNMSDSLTNSKKTIHIICLDDDSIVINSLVKKVQSLLKSSKLTNIYDFKIDICNNFRSFHTKMSNVSSGKHYNFFILDQNISMGVKGVDIAELTHKTYKFIYEDSYHKMLLDFIFVTEQAESLKEYFDKKFNPIFKEENVFGKRDHEAIVNRIGFIVNEYFNSY